MDVTLDMLAGYLNGVVEKQHGSYFLWYGKNHASCFVASSVEALIEETIENVMVWQRVAQGG